MATTTRKTTRRKTTKTPTPRKPRQKAVIAPVAPEHKPLLTEEQKQAKLEAYHTLMSAGLEIPKELADEVDEWIADLHKAQAAENQRLQDEAKAHEALVAEANQNGPWYVRNGYPAPFNFRLDRQTERRRIELKPRGVPGDMHPLKDEDLKDSVLQQNLNLGLIEIVPAGEAQLIFEKQTTNLGHRVHTPLAVLRNELGDTYEQGAVKVEAEFNSQGITVAAVDPRVMQGQLHDREIGGTRGTGGLTRVQPGQQVQANAEPTQANSVVRSGFVPTGGNPAIIQYGPTGANAQAKIVDDIARRKSIQGPAAGLGDIKVVVDPVVTT